jgi:hypothetical protein
VAWWGRFTLGIDERALWHVGPMKMCLLRREREWSISTVASDESDEEGMVVYPSTERLEENGVVKNRFTFRESPDTVHVRPVPPDRSLVVYPESAFHITAGESITLFCSIPLWIRVEVDGGDTLLDEALDRPADTWFGPNTREGELCYATKTSARLERRAVTRRAHRAVTELQIHNYASDTLHLERVNLAVPHLSVFAMEDGSLETESISLERTAGESTGKLSVGEAPRGRGTRLVTSPRVGPESEGTLVRAFSAWFG